MTLFDFTFRLLGGAVLAVSVVAVGCTGFADEVRAERHQNDRQLDQQADEAVEQLYDSMLEVFRSDTEGVDVQSRDQLTVISHYEAVDDQRRRRFVGRVVPAGGGIGVNITAEYQADASPDSHQPDWEDQPRELVEREAAPDELQLARRIERMFHGGGPP